MRTTTFLILVAAALIGGCASAPPLPVPDDLLHDELFAGNAVPRVDPAAPLALSPAMRSYLAGKQVQVRSARMFDRRRALIDALYRGDLRLEYDAAITRTASEAFDARSGNCLALVLMTSAFAKELGLRVTYQAVTGEEDWNRSSDMYIALGHVNLLLEDKNSLVDINYVSRAPLAIDFLPPRGRTVTRAIEENTVVAMYFNNRAVESLTDGRTAEAYWYAREAMRQDPQLASGYVTMAVVYRAMKRADLAEHALQRVLARDPDNLNALADHVLVLRDLGRAAEADAAAQRLAQLDPHPPYGYFNAGRAALQAGRLEEARRMFAKEIERMPYNHEFEYWLAVTYIEMKDPEQAARHLRKAMEVSTTRTSHDLYSAKLERLNALRQR